MTPWTLLTLLVAGANWAALLAVRGRWGWISAPLAVAAVVGTALGNAVGRRTGLELVQIGDFHLLAASVIAQVAMVSVLLIALLGSARRTD